MAGGGGGMQQPQFNADQVAQNQTTANVNTGVANAVLGNTNQVTPYGNLTYTQTGGQMVGNNWVPQYTATQTLSPDQQKIYDQGTALTQTALGGIAPGVLKQVQDTTSKPLSFANAPAMPTDQTAAKNAAYDALTARSTQDLNTQTQQLQTLLANQGIAPGTEAYNNAMLPLERARVDASNQATINAGNLAGQNINQAQTLRDQAINEATTLYNQPLNTYSALTGVSGGVQSPTYAPATQASIQTPDVTSPYVAQYQGQVAAYNQQLQQQNSMMGGLFGLGGSALGGLAMAGGRKLFGL